MFSFVPVALRAASTLKNRDFLEVHEFPFGGCCPAGGLDLGKSRFFGNQRISFLFILPCGRPRSWKNCFTGNKQISSLFMLPCGRPRSWKNTIFLQINEFPFCLCCPAGGLDLEKYHSLYLFHIL